MPTVSCVSVRNRAQQRGTVKPAASASGHMEKIGYVPRNKPVVLTESGLVSGQKQKDEALDEESAAGLARLQKTDAAIDESLGVVLKIVDNLTGIAGAMNEEVKNQTFKTKAIESTLSIVEEKQTIVNARQRRLLKTS